jgi:hypothetical protein
MPVVAWHLLSGRWLLLVLPSVYLTVRLYHRTFAFPERLMACSVLVFVLPFVGSALRGDGAPDRVFLSVLPLLCLCWGILAGRAVGGLKGSLLPGAVSGYILLAGFALLIGETRNRQKVVCDRLRNERCADLYFQYYLAAFNPRRRAADFHRTANRSLPIVNACLLDTELPKYLAFEGLNVLPADSLNRFRVGQLPVYVVADGPELATGAGPRIRFMEMPGIFNFPGIYRIIWRKLPPQ